MKLVKLQNDIIRVSGIYNCEVENPGCVFAMPSNTLSNTKIYYLHC